jgi:hypothetical protein
MGKLLRFACLLAIAAFTTCASIAAPLATPRAADPRPASEKAALPTDPLGRDTPYGTVVGFTRAINSQETERAAQYLEGAQAGQRKEELAHMLNTVLDRAAAVQLDKLSRQPEGHLVTVSRRISSRSRQFRWKNRRTSGSSCGACSTASPCWRIRRRTAPRA